VRKSDGLNKTHTNSRHFLHRNLLGLSFLFMLPYLFSFILQAFSYPVNVSYLYGNIRSVETIFVYLYAASILLLLISQINVFSNNNSKIKIILVGFSLALILCATGLQVYSDQTVPNKASNFALDVLMVFIFIIPLLLIAGYFYMLISSKTLRIKWIFVALAFLNAFLMILNVLSYFDISKMISLISHTTSIEGIISFIGYISFYCYFLGFSSFSISLGVLYINEYNPARKTS